MKYYLVWGGAIQDTSLIILVFLYSCFCCSFVYALFFYFFFILFFIIERSFSLSFQFGIRVCCLLSFLGVWWVKIRILVKKEDGERNKFSYFIVWWKDELFGVDKFRWNFLVQQGIDDAIEKTKPTSLEVGKSVSMKWRQRAIRLAKALKIKYNYLKETDPGGLEKLQAVEGCFINVMSLS